MSKVVDIIDDLKNIDGLTSPAQDTLVSGTNIKTVNGASLLGSGDISVSVFNPNTINLITTSTTYIIPTSGIYRIRAVGAGGGGAINTESTARGGGGGGCAVHQQYFNQGDTLTCVIGAAALWGTAITEQYPRVNGNNGGDTICTFGDTILFAGGGKGGKYDTNTDSGLGGTASGGNVFNTTGGRGGYIYSIGPVKFTATGGGGVTFAPGYETRGGDITGNTGSSSQYYATGGGGMYYRGGDILSINTASSNVKGATGGGGTGSAGEDIIVTSSINGQGGSGRELRFYSSGGTSGVSSSAAASTPSKYGGGQGGTATAGSTQSSSMGSGGILGGTGGTCFAVNSATLKMPAANYGGGQGGFSLVRNDGMLVQESKGGIIIIESEVPYEL